MWNSDELTIGWTPFKNETNFLRNEIIFFKSSGNGIHPPSKRKENRSRNRSLPRSSDKVTKDLLKLITEPLPTNQNEDSTDDDPPVCLDDA